MKFPIALQLYSVRDDMEKDFYGTIKLMKEIGYDGFLTEYAQYRKMQSEELFDLLAELQEDVAEYPTFEAWFAHMAEYTEQLQRQKAKEKKNTTEAVTLSTYHSAKGLEYHTVFLPELNEGLI